MGCFRPIKCLYNEFPTFEGARKLIFGVEKTYNDFEIEKMINANGYTLIDLPCGHCVGCALSRSLNWSCRVLCEMYTLKYFHNVTKSSFVTLTYDNEHLPKNKSVCREEIKSFMKRLRRFYDYYFNVQDIRFFACGEYGEKFGRPHYHLIIFGVDFLEIQNLLYRKTFESSKLISRFETNDSDLLVAPRWNSASTFDSPILSRLWNKGRVAIGFVTPRSVAYVSRYCCKKLLSCKVNKDYYKDVEPEFLQQSKSIGKEFFDRYYKEIYTINSVRFSERSFTIPRAFDKWLKERDLEYYNVVKGRRLEFINSDEFKKEHTEERLRVKEELQLERYKKLIRPYEMSGDFCSCLERKLVLAA